MRISTRLELDTLANQNSEILAILTDPSLGRRAAADLLDYYEYEVTDNLVRSWRENYKRLQEAQTELEAWNAAGIQKAQERIESYYNPFRTPQPFVTNSQDSAPKVAHTWNTITTSAKPVKKDKDKKVVAFGDFQINKHDPEFLAKGIDFLKDQQPDIVCLTGDESDNSAVGRWAKGMREEFESNLQNQIDETVDWITRIREAVPDAEIHMAHSNHMDWITKAVETRLPGFSSLRALTPEVMYQLKDLEINYQRKLFEFLPGFLLGHGHQWQLTSASHATKGPEHVMRTGMSILAGHTHQSILRPVFIGHEGKGEQKVYVNPGCMMDFEKAMESNGGYISGTSPNWSKGIVVITREAGQNYTELILGQNDGTFRYEGKIY